MPTEGPCPSMFPWSPYREAGEGGEMSASALLASTGKRCSQLLPHRVRPSTLGFLGVGRSLRPCLNAQVGKLRLLIVSPPYARKHGGAGRVTRSLQIHHVSSQGASTCRAAPTSHHPLSMRLTVTHHVPGHSSAWCRQAGPSGGFSSPHLHSCRK